MAYDQKNINTLDLRKSKGIGVSIPFNGPSVFKTVYDTKDQIKYNLINYIMTSPRERLYNPTFGLGIRRKLFDPMTDNTPSEIKQLIRSGIETYFPYLVINVLNIIVLPNQYQLNVEMKYLITNLNTIDEIFLNFNVNG